MRNQPGKNAGGKKPVRKIAVAKPSKRGVLSVGPMMSSDAARRGMASTRGSAQVRRYYAKKGK